ncbi:MAG: beta galactosidase jelly roll domain-containing protein [Bacteroidales bacterium]|nr:beta galactosidase jelly roll domain-containing protein [Bacteroidales bacterium]
MKKALLSISFLMLVPCLLSAKVVLRDWTMQSSLKVSGSEARIASSSFSDDSWHKVTLPTTVLGALVKEGVYPDPRFGMDNFSIPDVSDSFNERLGIKGENLWKDPWWFRTCFDLPEELQGCSTIWLNLDGINYRADIWLNGKKIADHSEVVGMFRRFRFDVSGAIRGKGNTLAIKIWQVDHPGTPSPGTQFILFGPNRGNAGDIFRDETLKMSGGWDCAPVVRDRNMGIWQDVWLEGSGAVTVEDPFVYSEVVSDHLARVSVSATLCNNSRRSVRGTFTARISHLDSLDMGSWTKHTPGDFTPVLRSCEVVLKPGERRKVAFYPIEIANPLLWYPNGYGQQHLHRMQMSFSCAGKQSHGVSFYFGIREIKTELLDKDGEKGLVFRVNGQRIFCRGGWLQPDILLDNSRKNIFDQARLLSEANVNLIGSEDMPSPGEDWLDSWDRYGLMDWHVFYQCYRMFPGRANAHNPDDHDLAEACARDEMLRYRNHPCIAAWFGVNEVMFDEDLYKATKAAAAELDPSRPFIPTTSTSWDVEKLTPWILEDLPSGTTDDGAPDYNWAPSDHYFDKVLEVRHQMFKNEMGMPGMPVYSSLREFIPTLDKPFDVRDRLFPLDSIWAEHGAWDANNFCYRAYDNAIRTFYSDPSSAEDYVRKAGMVSAEGYRAMFEAANHRMWDITTGLMIWKLNSCWPDVCWQIYDWFLESGAAYWFARKAMEPVHIQLNANSNIVSVINSTGKALEGLCSEVLVTGPDNREFWSWSGDASLTGESFRELTKVPFPKEAGPVYFIRLFLRDKEGKTLSENLYWRYSQHQNFYALTTLPRVEILKGVTIESDGRECIVKVTLRNDSPTVSFFNRIALESDQKPVRPVFWNDNFVTLFPGEEKVIEGRLSKEDAVGPVEIVIY